MKKTSFGYYENEKVFVNINATERPYSKRYLKNKKEKI